MGEKNYAFLGLGAFVSLAACEPVAHNSVVAEKCILLPPGYILPYDKWSPYPVCEVIPDATGYVAGIGADETGGGGSSSQSSIDGSSSTSQASTEPASSGAVSEAAEADARNNSAGAASVGSTGISEVSTTGDRDGDGRSDGATATSGDTTSSANAGDLL